MVEKLQIDNPANKSMHYGQLNVGVLNPPNSIPKATLYSEKDAIRRYHQMEYDIYQEQKHAKPPEKGKFPDILKCLGALISITGTIIFRKDISKFIRKIFK